jgi:hypothetical protein
VAVTLVAGMVGWDQSTRLVNDERREGSTGLGSVVVSSRRCSTPLPTFA